MAIEQDFKSFRDGTYSYGNSNQNAKKNVVKSYDEAYTFILEHDLLKDKLSTEIDSRIDEKATSKTIIKNKEFFRKMKSEYNIKVTEIVNKTGLKVRDYPDSTLFVKDVVDDMVGFSAIRDLMNNPYITDVYCIQWNKIYYEQSGHSVPIKYNGSFKNEKQYKDFIERLLREASKGVLDNGENKVVDFDLYEDRYNAISKAVSPNDFTLTIRKHREEHIKLEDIIDKEGQNGCINAEIANLIGMLIVGECNMIIGGITGSGKTTTMRAFLDYYVAKANKRMLVCEDTRELFLENDHTLELITSRGVDEKTTITLRDLIILALRQKPKYIIVGEVRGVEAESMIEAMETGHCTISSMHFGTPMEGMNRLNTKYTMQMPSLSSDVVDRIIGSAVDYLIIQDDIPGIGRKITSLTEVSYNFKEKRIKLNRIAEFNLHEKKFKIVGKISADKGEKLLRKGITEAQLEKYIDWNVE